MAAVAGAKNAGPGFTNGIEYAHVYYDFAKDGGATGALDLFTAGEDIVITHFHAKVMTTCTSGGSATLAVGVTGSTSLFGNATQGAVANLTAGAVIVPPAVEGTPNVLALPVRVASGDKVLQTIGAAALTAGKVKYTIGYIKA